VSQLPSLGPRGEGWVALQTGAILGVAISPRLGPRIEIGDPMVEVPARVFGLALLGVGLLLIFLAASALGRLGAFTIFPRPLEEGSLVRTGPFRLVRHPVYLGLVAAGLGATISQRTPSTLVATSILFVILDLKRRREEAWLAERYPEYAAYRARTKGLIPFLY
jgi:protein-S-isoprenylcysteine O-methyltransferase Ste14